MKYLIILLLLTSCSTTSLMKRYVKRGGTFEQVDKIVTVRDTIQGTDGKDSIVFRDLIVPCPDPVIETRWKTRLKYKFDNKRFKDSLRFVKRMYSDSLKNALKTHKVDGRNDRTETRQAAKVEKNENNNNTKQIKAIWNVWIILISFVMGWLLPKIAQRAWKKWK